MRIIFMGTPDFAVLALQNIIDSPEHEVVAVYSQPPKPIGRGHKVKLMPIHKLAADNNIPVLNPTSFKNADDVESFVNYNADIAVVAAYGLLLPDAILNAPKNGCLNIHSSILPRWRGAAPIHRAMLAGDKKTGVTIMQMDSGLDTGDMIAVKETTIDDNIYIQELHDTLANDGAELLMQVLGSYSGEAISPTPQPESGTTYAKKIKKDEGHINWNMTANEIYRHIRALNPWPGTYFYIEEEKFNILEADIITESHNHPTGITVDDKLTISCQDGYIIPTLIKRSGKKAMDGKSLLCGYKVDKNIQLS